MLILQSASGIVREFLMVGLDHLNGYTGGATVQVRLSKNGSPFIAGTGAVPQLLESGIYKYVYTTDDVNTLGGLTVSCRASGADPTDFIDQVVGFNPHTAWPSQSDIQNRLNEYGAVRPMTSGRLALVGGLGHVGLDWANITGVSSSGIVFSGTTFNHVLSVNSVSRSGGQEMADHFLRRGLAGNEGAAESRSVAWGFAKLVNKMGVANDTLTVYRTNDSTPLYTQSVTTSGGALPIIDVDTA